MRLAYGYSVDVDTAAQHLWRLHREARLRRVQRARRTLSSVLAATLLFVSTGAAVAASGTAVPGDSLYPVKRGAERVHLLVSFAPESDARLHLKFARARLAEAKHVAASRPQSVPALIGEVVAAVGHAEEIGGAVVMDEVQLVRAEVSAALPTLAGTVDGATAVTLHRFARQIDDPAVARGSGIEEPQGAGLAERPAADEPAGDRAAAPEPTIPPAATPAPEPDEPADAAADAAEAPPGDSAADAAEDPPPAAAPPPPPPPAPAVPATPPKAVPDIERLEAMLNDREP